jgi:hypothetical protein
VRDRSLTITMGLVLVLLQGASCDRNCPVGYQPRDALVDAAPILEARVDAGPRRDGSPGVGWAVSAGGTGDDEVWEMVVDGSSNIIIAGNIGATAQFGAIGVTSSGSAARRSQATPPGSWTCSSGREAPIHSEL